MRSFRVLPFLLAAVVSSALLIAACDTNDNLADEEVGITPAPPAADVESDADSDTEYTLVAENNLFDTDTLSVPANTEITIELDNQDARILHNFSVYASPDAGQPMFTGEPFAGAETRDYTFATPESGEYFFRCDTHPQTMTGTFIVE